MVKIAPSILNADFSRLQEQVGMMEAAGVEYLHLDIMDGAFVPNLSFGPPVIKSLRKISRLFFDTHLMIEEPARYLADYADAGSDLICVHAEACVHLHSTVQQIHSLGCKAAVSLNPATSLCVLDEILPEVDMVLLMSVNPGFGGQSFIPSTLDKINRLRRRIHIINKPIEIEVDGGINLNNAAQVVEAGADVLVIGSAIFSAPDPIAMVQQIRNAIK